MQKVLWMVLVGMCVPVFAASTNGGVSADPLDYVRAEVAKGARVISVPKGVYSVKPPKGEANYLALKGLKDVVIDFNGSELVGAFATGMLYLQNCTNVTVRNVSIDYAELPFTQAVIEKVDEERTWDVRVLAGYPRPGEEQIKNGDESFWPLQAYSAKTFEPKNYMRFRDNVKIVRTGEDTYRISGGLNRTGDVGDIAVWSIREIGRAISGNAVSAPGCARCNFENITVYATPHGCGFAEFSADGNRYFNCKLVRRPPETDLFPRAMKRLRSGNHDAFNSRCSYRGPVLDKCVFQYHCDDCVNISGYYAFVTKQEGRVLRIAPYGGKLRIDAGDDCQMMTFEGKCPKDVKVVSAIPDGDTTAEELKLFESYNLWPGIARSNRKAFKVTLDFDVDLPQGSVIISNRRMGNGFILRNCTMGHNRARGYLIKASDGLIENNVFEGVEGWAVQISPEYEWMEGGCSRDIVVRNNVFRNNGGGVLLAGNNGARKPLPADSHRNVSIIGNRIDGGHHGISVTGCTALDVRGNEINLKSKSSPVILKNVAKNVTDCIDGR